ncbi:MAG: N-6 DNA methylase [Lachnospiraceae bacterium]|nr:N-6 DNA methylase [Lachnospiraceae bacterium]
MNLKKDYKQYFTPDRLAEYMVNLIPDDSIRSVVDLSMGECGLLEEAKKDGKMLFYMVQI